MSRETPGARVKRLGDEEIRAMARIIRDPVLFARRILRHDTWTTAEQILQAVALHERVAVKACHSSGKTFTAAEIVLWWAMRHEDGKVITTAPTWTQVERLLWGEMRLAAAQSKIALPPMNKTELQLGDGNFAIGLSTNEGVRFQGFHGTLLVVLDEAPGVLGEIFDAIEGMRAGGKVHVVLLGNPVVASGPFYDAFGKDAASWHRFTISAFDTPNLAGVTLNDLLAMDDTALGDNVRSYLTTRKWVRQKYEEWGPDHPSYKARVLAQFPPQSEYSLVSLDWIERAAPRTASLEVLPIEAGVDVAGPGKAETSVTVRMGQNVILTRATAAADPRGQVVQWLAPFKDLPNFRVKVDSIGVGYNFGLHLQDLGFDVALVNVGEPSNDSEKFVNLKAEYYWGLRDRFEKGDIGGVSDPVQQAQLSTIEWRTTSRGQTFIVTKEEMKKRGILSPDRAESLMLAYAQPRRNVQLYDPTKYKKLYAH